MKKKTEKTEKKRLYTCNKCGYEFKIYKRYSYHINLSKA